MENGQKSANDATQTNYNGYHPFEHTRVEFMLRLDSTLVIYAGVPWASKCPFIGQGPNLGPHNAPCIPWKQKSIHVDDLCLGTPSVAI